mmetsp:Transcript_19540/g.74946  ORF Transcript_19540/g.74946 Transcript_19540/m.74946 type:complete len:249 (+) Transcript_19540:2347-3093(+)
MSRRRLRRAGAQATMVRPAAGPVRARAAPGEAQAGQAWRGCRAPLARPSPRPHTVSVPLSEGPASARRGCMLLATQADAWRCTAALRSGTLRSNRSAGLGCVVCVAWTRRSRRTAVFNQMLARPLAPRRERLHSTLAHESTDEILRRCGSVRSASTAFARLPIAAHTGEAAGAPTRTSATDAVANSVAERESTLLLRRCARYEPSSSLSKRLAPNATVAVASSVADSSISRRCHSTIPSEWKACARRV